MNLLQVATHYVCELHWSVIPIQPSRLGDRDSGKKPRIEWRPYQRRLPTSDELQSWFGVGTPKSNIGIVTGFVSNLYVVDADSPEGLAWVEAHCGPTACRAVTGGRGEHRFYRLAVGQMARNRTHVAGQAVDGRGEGGYVVAPPSTHSSGGQYRWLELSTPADWNDEWFPPLVAVPRSATTISSVTDDERVRRARAYVSRIQSVAGHGGERQLFAAARALVRRFGLSADVALQELRIWNSYCARPMWCDRKLVHTIQQAAKYP